MECVGGREREVGKSELRWSWTFVIKYCKLIMKTKTASFSAVTKLQITSKLQNLLLCVSWYVFQGQ